jgi:hypothetical protein
MLGDDQLQTLDGAERFAALKAMYFSGRHRSAEQLVTAWKTEKPEDPFAQYLAAILARHQLAPAPVWAADFDAGFACGLRHPAHQPSSRWWHGENIAGASITIWAEEGLGDFIRHTRHIQTVCRMAGTVILQAPAKILPLLAACFPECQITDDPRDIADSDWHIPSGSLDGLFWHPTEKPQSAGYMTLPQHSKPRSNDSVNVGVCSRSTKLAVFRNINYTSLDALAPVFADARYQCHSLQYRDVPAELAAANRSFARTVTAYPNRDFFDDLLMLAHTILDMDIVLATSTLVADLASALGVPTVRFHGIPAVNRETGDEALDAEAKGPNPDHCWYSECTTILYREAHIAWPHFFESVKPRLDEIAGFHQDT